MNHSIMLSFRDMPVAIALWLDAKRKSSDISAAVCSEPPARQAAAYAADDRCSRPLATSRFHRHFRQRTGSSDNIAPFNTHQKLDLKQIIWTNKNRPVFCSISLLDWEHVSVGSRPAYSAVIF